MYVYDLIPTHIDLIKASDTIIHTDGKMRTVTPRDMHYCSFMGRSLFGDSYWSGYKPVQRVEFKRFNPCQSKETSRRN